MLLQGLADPHLRCREYQMYKRTHTQRRRDSVTSSDHIFDLAADILFKFRK